MIAGSIAGGAAAHRHDAARPRRRPTSASSRSICALIILNIFLVMCGVVQERKDKVLLFMLSLPVSTDAVHVGEGRRATPSRSSCRGCC